MKKIRDCANRRPKISTEARILLPAKSPALKPITVIMKYDSYSIERKCLDDGVFIHFTDSEQEVRNWHRIMNAPVSSWKMFSTAESTSLSSSKGKGK